MSYTVSVSGLNHTLGSALSFGQSIVGKLRYCRLVIIEGVGHFPQVEAPQQFVAALTDFMATTEPAHLGARDRQRMLKERVVAIEQ